MKKILTILLLLIATQCFAQKDENGNPVFHSVGTDEEVIGDFMLLSNYYLLKTNIENQHSSVYIADTPTLAEIANAATTLPSDFFLITKKEVLINLITIVEQPSRQFMVINPTSGEKRLFACTLKGDITQSRAQEMIMEKYDPKAKMDGNYLYFDGKKLKIIPTKDIRNCVVALIKKEKLSASNDTTGPKILSKASLRKLILEKTKEGGDLDFFTEIKGKEYDGVQIKPGLFTTKIGVALYKWGRANFDFGVNKVEDAFSFFAEFKGRDLNQREKDYIRKGFLKELE